jgi:amino-acid N-acetyltransferase
MISIKKLQRAEIDTLNNLLQTENLPLVDQIDQNGYFFKAVGNSGEIFGAVGLELFGNHGLLRSLVVDKNYRRTGIAGRLVERVIRRSLKLKLKALFLLTTTADNYFEKKLFKEIARNEVPDEIKLSKEFSSICPSTAIVMHRIK